MTKTWFAVSALAVSLGATSGGMAVRAHAAPAPSPAQYEGQGRWDDAPSEYREVQRQGCRDGVEAARHDFETRSHKDADEHERYRHPRVERGLRDDYRHGFGAGARRGKRHKNE